MKVGIITILKVDNYGAELQAYASQKALNALGYDAEIIDYLFYKNPKARRCKASAPLFNYSVKKRLAEFLYPLIHRSSKNSVRTQRFEEFHTKHTRLSPTYHSADELYSASHPYDAFITGSDQVWNPGNYTSLRPYMLDFAPAGKPRIAYAASFGVSELPHDTIDFYRASLAKYSAIGVRESSATNIISGNLGMKATQVLDPTLLLDANQWSDIAEFPPALPEEYLLVYELTPTPAINTIAEKIALHRNIPIVRICKSNADTKPNQICVTDAGPAEFLGLIRNASFVVTNSFHGTAFSINFGREFLTVTPSRKANNSRQRDLLTLLGLEDRLVESDSNMHDLSLSAIDYDSASSRLAELRAQSVKFIKNAIEHNR